MATPELPPSEFARGPEPGEAGRGSGGVEGQNPEEFGQVSSTGNWEDPNAAGKDAGDSTEQQDPSLEVDSETFFQHLTEQYASPTLAQDTENRLEKAGVLQRLEEEGILPKREDDSEKRNNALKYIDIGARLGQYYQEVTAELQDTDRPPQRGNLLDARDRRGRRKIAFKGIRVYSNEELDEMARKRRDEESKKGND